MTELMIAKRLREAVEALFDVELDFVQAAADQSCVGTIRLRDVAIRQTILLTDNSLPSQITVYAKYWVYDIRCLQLEADRASFDEILLDFSKPGKYPPKLVAAARSGSYLVECKLAYIRNISTIVKQISRAFDSQFTG